MLRKILRKVKNKLRSSKPKYDNNLEYWEDRSKKYGARAALNIQHGDDEIEAMNKHQMEQIFPHLQRKLNGSEKTIVDFGCGPGRFTPYLSKLIKGKAIGVDPIKDLIDLAPKDENTSYLLIKDGKIPMEDNSADVFWVCLVLGGIKEENLKDVSKEINRVLKNNGILCLSENTSDKKNAEFWYFRKVEWYQELFKSIDLKKVNTYDDVGETISVMVGRKSDN